MTAATQIFRALRMATRDGERVGFHRTAPCADCGNILCVAAGKMRDGRGANADDCPTGFGDAALKVAMELAFMRRLGKCIIGARKVVEPML